MSVRQDRILLATLYPALFTTPGERSRPKLPLKIGTYKDIVDRAPSDENGPLSADRIRAALKDYTRGTRYKKALAYHPHRYDLDGNIVGTVDQDIAERNKQTLARWRKASAKSKATATTVNERYLVIERRQCRYVLTLIEDRRPQVDRREEGRFTILQVPPDRLESTLDEFIAEHQEAIGLGVKPFADWPVGAPPPKPDHRAAETAAMRAERAARHNRPAFENPPFQKARPL